MNLASLNTEVTVCLVQFNDGWRIEVSFDADAKPMYSTQSFGSRSEAERVMQEWCAELCAEIGATQMTAH